MFVVRLHPAAAKALARFGAADQKRIKKGLQRLADDPKMKRSGADIKRLQGTRGRQDLFRIRIGEFRAIYAVEGNQVLITEIFPRGQGYDI